METCRILLRADTGASVGLGHFSRCCALAASLRRRFDCFLISRNHEGRPLSPLQHSMLKDAGAGFIEVKGDTQEEFDAAFLGIVAQDDIVVLDNYYFSTDYQRKVRERAGALVALDDLHARHFVADAVITVSPLRREDFSLEPYSRFLGGVDYAFLRAPFLDTPRRERIAGAPKRAAVAMGGADPYRLSGRIVSLLEEIIPGVECDIIAGPTVDLSELSGSRHHIWREVGAEQIVGIFDSADIAVLPASTVCVEAFSRGLPVAAGYYADNQLDFYRGGVSAGWFAPLDDLRDSEYELRGRIRAALSDDRKAPDFDFAARRREVTDLFEELRGLCG